MSDNIFNYFSSKGTRKVDPIDDAEFDSIDAPTAPSDPPPPLATQGSAMEDVASDIVPTEMAAQGSSIPQSSSPPLKQSSPTDQPPKKSQSHWDYLASLLGIKKESSSDTPEENSISVSGKKQEPPEVSARHEPLKPKSTDWFESASKVPIKEEAKEPAILSSMFSAGSSAANESAGIETKSSNSPELSDDELDDDFVEFEVEDLDKSGDEDDSQRKSRRSFSRSSSPPDSTLTEGRSRNDSRRGGDRDRQPNRQRQDHQRKRDDSGASTQAETPSQERPARIHRSRQDRDPQSRDRQGREPAVRDEAYQAGQKRREHSAGPDVGRGNENRPERGALRNAPERGALRNAPERGALRNAPAAQTRSDDSFGSGIFEEPAEKDEARFEEELPRKRRRRRRGRDSTSRASAPSSLPRHSPLPEVDPPDEFFDEVGWQPAHAPRQARPDSSNHLDEDPFDRDDSDFPATQEEETDQGERTTRKRRRRRPRGRRDATSSDATTATTDDNFENRTEASREHIEVENDEFDYDQAHRKPRHPRQPAGSSRTPDHNLDSDAPSEATKKGKKFPTWEEAISVLVESNIKNHARSPGQNRSGGNRGRPRR